MPAIQPAHATRSTPQNARRVAAVLLADTGLASRLAIKGLLSAAGYAVDSAASAAEAIGKLDCGEYQLVLADLRAESLEAGPQILAYAGQKEYRPATALIASELSEPGKPFSLDESDERVVRISDENVSYLLELAAELVGQRAQRRSRLPV
jgi:CheY-like chemotaxis protein